MLEALLLGELLGDGGRLSDRLRRRLARCLVPSLWANGRGVGGGGGGGPRQWRELHGARLGEDIGRERAIQLCLGKKLAVSA